MPTTAQINVVSGTKHVAVMGAGAVGSYFGGMLARAGVPVTMIARGLIWKRCAATNFFWTLFRFKSGLRWRLRGAIRGA